MCPNPNPNLKPYGGVSRFFCVCKPTHRIFKLNTKVTRLVDTVLELFWIQFLEGGIILFPDTIPDTVT